MKHTWTIRFGAAIFSTIVTIGFLTVSSPVHADSGAIRLQQLPDLAFESEGSEDVPPGVDSNLVASASFNTNGFGRVLLTKINGVQTFFVEADNLTPGVTAFNFAYGVFIEGSNGFYHVGDLSMFKYSKKKQLGNWRLQFTNKNNAAPPELGVADLGDLAGREVRIITSPLSSPSPNMVALHAILPPVLKDPIVLTASANITMSRPPAGPGSPPSPQAVGKLAIRFDGKTGRSVLSVQASGLEKGTGYTVYIETAPDSGIFTELDELNEPANFPNGLASGSLVLDTQIGTPIGFFADTPHTLAGRKIVVADTFFDYLNPANDSIHLTATIPVFP